MTPRPIKHCHLVRSAVAKELAQRIWTPNKGDTVDDVAGTIAMCLYKERDWDGFRIAKRLDNDGWAVDAEMVATLDLAEVYALEVVDRLVQKWVVDNKIEPLFAVGDAVMWRQKWYVVNGIRYGTARYALWNETVSKIRTLGNGTLAPYEEVTK